MRKRIISWGLAAAMAAGLTACSGGQTAESTDAPQSTDAPAAETTAAETTQASAGSGISGTFSGSAAGMQGTVSVELTVEDGVITAVNVTENHETPSLTGVVFERIPAQIVNYQTTTLDAVTGATYASNALMRAASQAAEAAGLTGDHLSKRQEMKELINRFRTINSHIETNIFKSVENVNLDACIGYVKDGARHHFLENY